MLKQILNSLILCCSKVNIKSECCSNQEIENKNNKEKQTIKIKKGFFCSVTRYKSKSNLNLQVPALQETVVEVVD